MHSGSGRDAQPALLPSQPSGKYGKIRPWQKIGSSVYLISLLRHSWRCSDVAILVLGRVEEWHRSSLKTKCSTLPGKTFDNICNEMKGSPVVGLEESFDQEG